MDNKDQGDFMKKHLLFISLSSSCYKDLLHYHQIYSLECRERISKLK